ncbi:hypothetical protein GGI12_005552 [Dipsacomyces acuminosporus]|nr:hypothetical protein GGI12_005552 [Dipsacomyces acuminosporus]
MSTATPATPPSEPAAAALPAVADNARMLLLAQITRGHVKMAMRTLPDSSRYDYSCSLKDPHNYTVLDNFVEEISTMTTVRRLAFDKYEIRRALTTYFKSCKDSARRTPGKQTKVREAAKKCHVRRKRARQQNCK